MRVHTVLSSAGAGMYAARLRWVSGEVREGPFACEAAAAAPVFAAGAVGESGALALGSSASAFACWLFFFWPERKNRNAPRRVRAAVPAMEPTTAPARAPLLTPGLGWPSDWLVALVLAAAEVLAMLLLALGIGTLEDSAREGEGWWEIRSEDKEVVGVPVLVVVSVLVSLAGAPVVAVVVLAVEAVEVVFGGPGVQGGAEESCGRGLDDSAAVAVGAVVCGDAVGASQGDCDMLAARQANA